MRTLKIIGLLAAMIIGFTSCETEVIDPAGDRGVGMVTTITDANPAIFVAGDLDVSYTQFTVNAEEGASFDEAYIVVSYNGVAERTKILDIDAFPQVVSITAAETATTLGLSIEDIESEDYFVFEVEVKINGKVYRSNGGITVKVVCPFEPTLAEGSYTAVSEGWAVNGGITITADVDDPYTIYVTGLAELDGLTEDQGPLMMQINPLNFEVTAPKAVLASSAFGYTNIAYQGFGEFNSCTGDYEMLFTITVDQGSFGQYEFSFIRN